MGKLKTYTAAILALALFISAFVGVIVLGSQFSTPINEGTYEGQTIDYSHQRGLYFQTNDLTTKTHERSSEREDWCIPDNRPELVEKVRGIPEGSEVRIEYARPLWIDPDTCQGGMKVVKDIHVLNEST